MIVGGLQFYESNILILLTFSLQVFFNLLDKLL